MNRLTRKKRHNVCDGGRHPTAYTSGHTFQEVVARLAAYEDTGLEPEGIKEHEAAYIELMTRTYGPFHQKIGQWLQAEQNGQLLVRQNLDCLPPQAGGGDNMKVEYAGQVVDLLPCPFCGGEPRIYNFRRHGEWYRIRCVGDCSVHPETYTYHSLEEVLAIWNRRLGAGGAS